MLKNVKDFCFFLSYSVHITVCTVSVSVFVSAAMKALTILGRDVIGHYLFSSPALK